MCYYGTWTYGWIPGLLGIARIVLTVFSVSCFLVFFVAFSGAIGVCYLSFAFVPGLCISGRALAGRAGLAAVGLIKRLSDVGWVAGNVADTTIMAIAAKGGAFFVGFPCSVYVVLLIGQDLVGGGTP